MRKDVQGFFWDDTPPPKVIKEKAPKRVPPERTWERPDYLPGLVESQAFVRDYVPPTDAEIMQMYYARETLVYDIECYINYFLVAFKSMQSGKVIYFEMVPGQQLDTTKLLWVLKNFQTVGFNSRNYDNTLSALAVAGAQCQHLKQATNMIIVEEIAPWNVLRHFNVKRLVLDHIDVQEVVPGFGSLKLYGGRMHERKLQDLPFPHDTVLSAAQIDIIRFYCINDLDTTASLRRAIDEEIHIREIMSQQYGMDLRSRSDAQIAEDVITHEVTEILGYKPQKPQLEIGRTYQFRPPHFIRYQSGLMQSVLKVVTDSIFIVGEDGKVKQPYTMNSLKFTIGDTTYQMGIGGLHSCEKVMQHVCGPDDVLRDKDVTSYYPIAIIEQNLYPPHLGQAFVQVFKGIVARRIAAKQAGDKKTAQTLKIVINGSYGKFGSMYSMLYSPNLIIQVTLTGQLSLLMLIEALEMSGVSVVSANTDGIVLKYKKHQQSLVDQICEWWERETHFELEDTDYMRLNCANVNNYIAMKPDGETKRKGWFGETGLAKNCEGEIIMEAICLALQKGVPVSKTIRECKDLTKFLCVRSVSGGACQAGVPLGKVVRWYYSNEPQEEIIYIKNGNKVAKTGGGRPMMELTTELPSDIDFEYYINSATKLLEKLAYC